MMKKLILYFQFAALSLSSSAFALTGGPFDNGEYGLLSERSSFYQCSFTFPNGNGYALWTADNQVGTLNNGGQVTPNFGSGSLLTLASGSAFTDHNGNRSVFYYKGVTYLGSALGQVDVASREISGVCNASSDVRGTTQTSQTQGVFIGQTSNTVTDSGAVLSNGRSYVANLSWQAKITRTSPQFRFSGTGELSVIAPNGREAIAGLAYSGYSGLISAINASVSAQGSTAILGINPGLYTSAQTAINNALTGLVPFLTGTGPDNSFRESDIAKAKVKGFRRYF
jgi:hypothetical protein